MANVGSVAGAIPVADLTYQGHEILPDVSQNDFARINFPATGFVSPLVYQPPVFELLPVAFLEPAVAPSASAPKIDPPLSGGEKMGTSRSYEHLGSTTCEPLENGKVLLFEIERFPVSDAGACDVALVVLRHLKALNLNSAMPVVVHLRSISHDYVDKYSGKQLPEHELYPCCLLDQALPIGTRFKVVSGDSGFIASLRERGYSSFVEESVDQVMLKERRSWREAGLVGEEYSHLPTYREMIEGGVVALENRRSQALDAASRFTSSAAAQVQPQAAIVEAEFRQALTVL